MKLFQPATPVAWRSGVAFALGAATCFHLAYAPVEFAPLRLLALPFLIFLVQLARLKTTRLAFYTGLGTGLLCIAPQLACFWTIFGPAAVPLWFVLAFWIALFVALAHVLLRRLGAGWACVLIPFVWTGLEYFRSELYFLKFSWLNAGYAFANTPLQPLHSIGVYGIGFLAAVCAALFLTWRWKPALAGTALVTGCSAVVSLVEPEEFASPPLRITGIQLEFPAENHLPHALDLALAKHPNSDVLVLSEYTLDGPVPHSLRQWCRENQRHLIVGGKDPAPNGTFYNTAFVINPTGEIVFKQVKSVPIQFFKDGLPAPRQALWNSPWGNIGICVCYDLSYTRVVDRLVDMGAQLLIVPTMDVAEWGKRQHELHGLIAPARAAEHGLPVFRLASSGISQAIDARGRVLAKGEFPGENEIVSAELRPATAGKKPIDRVLAPFAVFVTGLSLLAAGASAISDRLKLARGRLAAGIRIVTS